MAPAVLQIPAREESIVEERRPVALITGISGQDGSYLTEFLLARGYVVHGLVACGVPARLEGPLATHPDVHLHPADLTDGANLHSVLLQARPREVYHLAAQSDVRLSFDIPVHTANVVALGTLRLLEAIRAFEQASGDRVRFYQAGSSEMFGRATEAPQTELTPFHPRTPYACAKVFAYWQTINYREAYGMFACNGIMYNHESPRRGAAYVTRKITRAATRIKLGLQQKLTLGNIDGQRDWGFAGDYVEAMWLMLQQPEPDDYVIATGQLHTVREFLSEVFGHFDLDWQAYVEFDKNLLRPADVSQLYGDASKARRTLGWQPRVGFRELARMMAEHDLRLARQERWLQAQGGSNDDASSRDVRPLGPG